MKKVYFAYKFKKWNDARDTLVALSQFRKLIEKKDGERGGNLWGCIESINRYVNDAESDKTREKDPQWQLEKACISLYDVDLCKKFLAGLTGSVAIRENLDEIYDELLEQLGWIKIITDGPDFDNMPYSAEELSDALSGKAGDPPPGRLIRTLIETILDKDGHDNARTITAFLGKEGIARIEEMEMIDVLIFTLMINFLYRRFTVLKSFQQRFLLQLNFYKAIVLGVPVRQYVREELLRFVLEDNIIGFTESNRILFEWLQLSEEMVSGKNGKSVNIREIYDAVLINGAGGLKRHVDNLFRDWPNADYYTEWLNEACSIFVGLKEATLVDYEKEKIVPEYELIQQDLEQMMMSFGYGEMFEFIVGYFQKKDGRVGLRQFIDALKNVADLGQDGDIEKVVKLVNVLHQNNILPEDRELVEFDEQQGKFVWKE